MPQSQQSKEEPIKEAVAPQTPQPVTPPQSEVFMSIGGSGKNLNAAPQVASGQQDADIDDNALLEGTEYVDVNKELLAGSEYGLEEDLLAGYKEPDQQTLLDKAKEAHKYIDMPHQWARKKAVEGIDELFKASGYQELPYNSVWANVVHGTPKIIVEALAETGADIATDPVSLVTMGYSKGMGMVMGSKVGKNVIKPFLKASADYYAGRIPEMMRHAPHKVKMAVADLALAAGETLDYVAKDAVGKGVVAGAFKTAADPLIGPISKGVDYSLKAGGAIVTKGVDMLNSISPNITRWTSYKYGLPGVEAWLKVARDDKRIRADASILAAKMGTTLWQGLSKEAQIIATDMLESGNLGIGKLEKTMPWYVDALKKAGVTDPKRVAKDVINIRRLVDSWSTKYAKDGLASGTINEDLYDIIMKNRETYMRRLWVIHEDRAISKRLSSGEITLADALGLAEDIEVKLANAGLSPDSIAAFSSFPVQKKIAWANKLGVKYKGKRVSKQSYTTSDALRKRKMLSAIDKRFLGLEGVGYRSARTLEELSNKVQAIKTTKLISENPDWALPVKGGVWPSGWVKLVGQKYGYLQNHYVHPQIVDEMYKISQMDIDGEIGRYFWNIYKKTHGTWKTMKVPLSPASHFNNNIGQAMFNDLSGFDILEQQKYLKIAEKNIAKNGKWMREAHENNLFTSSRVEQEMFSTLQSPVEKVGKKTGALTKILKHPSKKATESFVGIDNKYKLARYIWEREGGKTAKEALTESLKWNFDYEAISPAVRAVRDMPLFGTPFFTFQALAAPRLVETVLMNPFAVYKWVKLYNNFNENSLKEIGAKKEDLDYIESKIGPQFVMPARTKTGKPVVVSAGNTLAVVLDVVRYLKGESLMEIAKSKFQESGPLPLLDEARRGKTEGKHAKDIYESYDPERVKIKKQVAHVYNGFVPTWAPGLDVGLKPTQSSINFAAKQMGIKIPDIAQRAVDKMTFESDVVSMGGLSARAISNAIYHDITDITEDGDGVKHEQLAEDFHKVFNPEVIKGFADESVLPQAVLYSVIGVNVKALDVTMFKVMDAARLKELDENGIIYKKFVGKLNSLKLTPRQRSLMIENYMENLRTVVLEWKEAKEKGLVKDDEVPSDNITP